jgi:hypothetical protein
LDTALIRFDEASVCCVLHNLSDSGAALDIRQQTGIPDQFTRRALACISFSRSISRRPTVTSLFPDCTAQEDLLLHRDLAKENALGRFVLLTHANS